MIKPIFDELARDAAEAPLHRRHLRRRDPPQPADRPRRSGTRARRARCRRCSSGSAPTARSAPTRRRSRSSARAPTCSPRATSSTTPRSRARSPSRTCASGPSRSARPTSSTTPTSSPATSSGCSSKIEGARARQARARRSCSTRPYGPDEVWDHLPVEVQRQLDRQGASTSGSSTPLAVADEAGMGNRINTVMQPCFFQLAGRPAGRRGDRPHQGASSRRPTPSAARRSSSATSPRSTARSQRLAPRRRPGRRHQRRGADAPPCPTTRPTSSRGSPRG